MHKFFILTAAYYLQICCFWTKTCKLICWYPGSEPGGYLSAATPMLLAICTSASGSLLFHHNVILAEAVISSEVNAIYLIV